MKNYFFFKNSISAITKLTTAVTVRIISMIGLTKSYVWSSTKTNPKKMAPSKMRILSVKFITYAVRLSAVNPGFLSQFSQISDLHHLQLFFLKLRKLHIMNRLQ